MNLQKSKTDIRQFFSTSQNWKRLALFVVTLLLLKDMSKVLGHQVEVEVSYNFLKFCTLAAGYTYMHGSEAMERLRRSTEKRHLHWGWLKLSVSPRVFYVKW